MARPEAEDTLPEEKPHVYIPEVLPPEEEGPRQERQREPQRPTRPAAGRKILAGLIIDAMDLVLRGALGLKLGLPLGFVAGLLLGRWLGLSPGRTLLLGLVAGLYCAAPMTGRIPLATVVGLLSALPGPAPRR